MKHLGNLPSKSTDKSSHVADSHRIGIASHAIWMGRHEFELRDELPGNQ